MNRLKTIYWSVTILLFSMMISTGILYVVFYDKLVVYFISYGYPTYLIYPLAVIYVVGSIVIFYNKNKFLKELAYAGFFFDFVLAFFAHYMIDEFDLFPTVFLILLIVSYFTGKKVRP